MNYKDILAMAEAYAKVAKKEAMDPVDAKELKGKHKDRKDKDIDNDGNVDKSDEYLHKRRKAVSKAMNGKGTEVEVQTQESKLMTQADKIKALNKSSSAKMKKSMDKLRKAGKTNEEVETQESKLMTKAQKRALQNIKAQPKDKVSLKKAPWDMKKEEVELEEQKTPYIVVDTADGNKVVAMASDEKGAKSSIFHAERPPMSIKDKSTLKVVKSNKKQSIGYPLKEDVEVTELHMSLLEAHGIEKKVAERVKKVFDDMSDADKAAFMKAYLKNPKAATEYMFKDMKKMAKEEVEIEEASQPKWIVTVVKPINKLKKGMKVIVPARNTAEALKKALKRMGENIDAAIGSRHLDVKLDNGGMKKMAKEEVEYLEELTAAEKKLIAQMYDKKGNLTPLGKKVMDHGKAASKLTPKDAAADNARRKEYNAYQKSKRNEEVELDEATATVKQQKALKALMTKALDGKRAKPGTTSAIATNGDFVVKDSGSRIIGRLKAGTYTDPLKETVEEAKDHGNTNNGSPSGEGLSPSAKKELERKTPMNPATDAEAVNNLNFKTFKAMSKKAPMRSNDNAQGDKTQPKAGK